MKKFFLGTFVTMFIFSFVVVFIAVPIYAANALPAEIRLTYDEFSSNAPIYVPHARFLRQNSNYETAVGEDDEKFVQLKLFGIIPVKKIKVEPLPFDKVIAGGQVIGFLAGIDGVLVTVDSKENGLKKGDIIRRVDGEVIYSIQDFEGVISKTPKRGMMSAEVLRAGKVIETKIRVEKPLGLWLKDETSGVGTLTYINPENNNFASLGHKLNDFETGTNVDVRGGTIYNCRIFGIEKSEGRKVGSYRSNLKQTPETIQGDITSSNFAGVFGCLYSESEILSNSSVKYPVSSRYNVRPGKAKLRTTLDGAVREFDIEIVKTRFQKTPGTKSMVIKIMDKELLNASGGIIHGMSGSPIIQNGKIVGALTHVVMGDPSRGYGIYIDFVIP
ncbi:MAG: hypothetical protein FWE16_01900 [Firmicutes bacterium]|nr:hypothetical protein [Bacillota bacterium]